MARPRQSKEDRLLAKHLKILGVNVDGSSVPDVVNSFATIPEADRIANITRELKQQAERKQLEAESVLYYIKANGKGFVEKNCEECLQPFVTTYIAVSFCSEMCRSKALFKLGILWNPRGKTDEERWGGRIPKVLGVEAVKATREALLNIIREGDEEDDIEQQEALAAVMEAIEEVPYVPETPKVDEE